MRNVVNYIGVEWKLMFRGYGIWIILSGLLGIFYLVSSEAYYNSNLGFKAMHTLMMLLPLFISIFFLAMYVARREATTRTQFLLPSLPYKTREIVASKLLALAIPFTLLQLMPALLYLFLATRIGFSFTELRSGFYILLASVIPGWFILLVGYLIGSMSKKRTIYLLGIFVFISLTYGVNLFLTKLAPFLDIVDFTQLDFFAPMQSTKVYSKIWGFTLDCNYWLHRLFYLSLIIGLVWSYIYWKAWKRKELANHNRYYVAISLISIILLSSLAAYISVWQGRVQGFHHELVLYKSAKPQIYSSSYEQIIASDYQLDVTTNDRHKLEVTAHFIITNLTGAEQARFPLTLRHNFHVQEVLINDQKAAADSAGNEDVIWITPNQALKVGEALKVKLVYSGPVDEWRNMPQYEGNLLIRSVFVDSDRINLLGSYGWYPIGGIHLLTEYGLDYEPKHYLKDHTFQAPLSDFKVAVHTASNFKLYSNGIVTSEKQALNKLNIDFIAKQASGFSLVGGALQIVEHTASDKTLRLIAGKQMNTKQQEMKLSFLAETAQQLQDILELTMGIKVKNPLGANETFMTLGDNDPFGAIENPNSTYNSESKQAWRSPFNNINGIKLLPATFTWELLPQKAQIIQWLLPQYMEGETRLNISTEGVFYDLLAAYMTVKPSDKKEDLLTRKFDNGNPNLIHALINDVYLKSSDEHFQIFIRDLYTELTKSDGTYEQTRQRLLTFIKSRADRQL
ncbi:hypothetical protein EHS13_12000 [Paenibacillus psychroresistens]|uniref:Uncharacterized protein n=1 Tax=Paenibacillus psychroresistens TaxID=1778678 RepID=A0A6B8RGG8_9BACL|nr:hypothetical protein [Paenibacillus psychroresistens]QGQ95551.1 hypothetical protein EHS13_12000 [Paenibacillus psychroresistens]